MSITDQQFLDWQKSDAPKRVLLVEADPYVGAVGAGAITTRYLSNRGYVTGPAESPVNIAYEDRITATPAFTARMGELLLGRSTPAWGDLEIFNGDGTLDAWLDDGWDGCAIRIYLGDGAWAKSDFRLVATLTASAITARDSTTLAVKIKDFHHWLDVPLTTEVMGTGPNANSLKPVCYGFCRNITPVCENTGTLKYRVNAFEIQSIDQVRDNGVSVAFTADLADGSFVLSAAPSGTVTADVCGGGRSFGSMWINNDSGGVAVTTKVGSGNTVVGGTFSAAAHSFTASSGTPFSSGFSHYNLLGATNKQNNGMHKVKSLIGGGAGAVLETRLVDETPSAITIYTTGVGTIGYANHKSLWAGYLMRRIIERHTSLASAQLGVSYYDLPPQAAFYTTSGATVAEALDKLATAAVGFYSFDESGVLYAGMVTEPSALTASASIVADEVEMRSMRVIRDIPAYSGIKLLLEKNWTQQTTFAGAVTDANRAKWTGSHYSLTTSSASNSSKYPLAVEKESASDDVLAFDHYSIDAIETFSYDVNEVDIKTNLVSLFGVTRRIYSFDTKAAPHTLRLGQAINLTHSRFGFNAGVNALVVGIVRNFSTGLTTLEVLK